MIGGQHTLEDFTVGQSVVAAKTINLGAGWEVPLGRWGVVKHFEPDRQHPIVVRFEAGMGDVTVSPDEINPGRER